MTTTQVGLSCANCGSDQFKRPDNPKPQDEVTCAGCGAVSTYGEVMESAKKQVLDAVSAKFRDLFKN